jgi:sporulation protein YabP
MANTADNRALEAPHKLTLDARHRLSMTGVAEVESFDEAEVVLSTTKGALVVRGRGLHLQMLSLDGGQVTVDGDVDSLTYEDAPRPGGFFARLFG